MGAIADMTANQLTSEYSNPLQMPSIQMPQAGAEPSDQVPATPSMSVNPGSDPAASGSSGGSSGMGGMISGIMSMV